MHCWQIWTAHTFSVKFSPCMLVAPARVWPTRLHACCSRTSFLDWRNGCNLSACTPISYMYLHVVRTLLLDNMKFCLPNSWTADSDKLCYYAWFVCHDKSLNWQCIARSGSPHNDESSYYMAFVHYLSVCNPQIYFFRVNSLSKTMLVKCLK